MDLELLDIYILHTVTVIFKWFVEAYVELLSNT